MEINKKRIKLTFTGDIMCDMLEIAAYKDSIGAYDFFEKFSSCKKYFLESDFVVGNLETPIGNSDYCSEKYTFNSPVELVQAIKKCGISLVTTANNHCLDRGVKGLEDTIELLDKVGLKHIGTNLNPLHKHQTTGIIESINGINIGFLSYTYGTNAFHNQNYLKRKEIYKVNLYQEQELHNKIFRKIYYSRGYTLYKEIIERFAGKILHKKIFSPVYERNEGRRYFKKRIKQDIINMRRLGADYIIMCLHAGGQFNTQPLNKTKKIIKQLVHLGVDSVICNHEHVIHSYKKIESNKVAAFSLGNFSSTIGVQIPPYDKMADYSILFNLYLLKDNLGVKLERYSFSIARSIPIADGQIKTVLLYDLINNCNNEEEKRELFADNIKIYNTFTNSRCENINLEREYFL